MLWFYRIIKTILKGALEEDCDAQPILYTNGKSVQSFRHNDLISVSNIFILRIIITFGFHCEKFGVILMNVFGNFNGTNIYHILPGICSANT